jgi:hypothetical protein
MDDKDDEQVLRQRILDLKVQEVKLKIAKLKEHRKELLGEPRVTSSPKGPDTGIIAIFAIVLTIVALAVAVVLFVSPTPLKP